MNKFTDFEVSQNIKDAINDIGHDTPTLVQEKAIPALLKGDDIIILSQTGSGKTLAFGIPALESVDAEIKKPQVLIICPTRELATQVSEELKKICKYMPGVKVFAVFGGQPIYKQIEGLKGKPQIIVGTPGRLIDHIERRTLRLETVNMLVLDEADEMLKMGFREDIEEISRKLAGKRQGVLASATMSQEIKILSQKFLTNPITIDAGDANSPAKSIHQEYITVSPKAKKQLLMDMLQKLDGTALIFCNTKKMTTSLFEYLNEQNIPAKEIHGDMRQSERTKAMNAFKKGVARILVATDVAARGIDVNNITYVINYDYPEIDNYYIHRIGRTGRAGNTGIAYTFITTGNQMASLNSLSKKLNFTIIKSSLSTDVKFSITSTNSSSRSSSYNRGGFRGNSNRKPYATKEGYTKSDSYNKKPSYNRADDANKKPGYFDKKESFGDNNRSNRKPYTKRDENSTNRKLYAKRDDSGFKKPYVKRNENNSDKRPYTKKEFTSNKPYAKMDEKSYDRKPYAKSEYAPRKTYSRTEASPKKNYEDRNMTDSKNSTESKSTGTGFNFKKPQSGFQKFYDKKNSSNKSAFKAKGTNSYKGVKNNSSMRTRPSGNKV